MSETGNTHPQTLDIHATDVTCGMPHQLLLRVQDHSRLQSGIREVSGICDYSTWPWASCLDLELSVLEQLLWTG